MCVSKASEGNFEKFLTSMAHDPIEERSSFMAMIFFENLVLDGVNLKKDSS